MTRSMEKGNIALYLSRLTILELERQINLKSQEIKGLIKSNKKGNVEELGKGYQNSQAITEF